MLFVDNLDFYDDKERLTVIDLVREAAKVPRMSVIVTTRRDFGIAEPCWLPADVINQLGRAEPVVIDELSDAETEELRNAAPNLRALLADNHPARQVARNLFRLSRLAGLSSDAPVVRTEVEMDQQWWESADGQKDQNHRDRARVLRALAEQAFSRSEPLDAREVPSAAAAALVKSETLRNLGDDRVTFRHDGVVILSKHFFEKHWPEQELNGLATREVGGKKVILPVWHGVGFEEVRQYSPTLADRLAVPTKNGLESVVAELLKAMK